MGGFVTHLNYDLGSAGLHGGIPVLSLNLFDAVLAYSHEEKQWWGAATLLSDASNEDRREEALRKIHNLKKLLLSAVRDQHQLHVAPRTAQGYFTDFQYKDAVARALEYIAAGDIYQVNLAQRFSVPWEDGPAALYWIMRSASPARYGAFLGSGLLSGGQALCSISPELFLRVRGREVTTRPIKGTRARGATPERNEGARGELQSSLKEQAELNMIVDLERNDLGRVCEWNSVRVDSPGEVEELPTLLHRVATVSGLLRKDVTLVQLLRAAFPGGSVTGAPKIRAMEIIDELEPFSRGPYCGAIGWIGLDGDLELNLAIRTAVCDENKREACYYAGSGIVADSDPAAEYQETLLKAEAFFRAANATLIP